MVLGNAMRSKWNDAELGGFDWIHALTVPRPHIKSYCVRRDLDLIVVLSVLQFLVLAVLREPSVS